MCSQVYFQHSRWTYRAFDIFIYYLWFFCLYGKFYVAISIVNWRFWITMLLVLCKGKSRTKYAAWAMRMFEDNFWYQDENAAFYRNRLVRESVIPSNIVVWKRVNTILTRFQTTILHGITDDILLNWYSVCFWQ